MNASAAGPSRDGHTVRHAVQVDLVTPSQHESLVDLLCELHAYYNEHATVPRDLVRNYLVDTLLGADSPLQLAVAFDNDTVLASPPSR